MPSLLKPALVTAPLALIFGFLGAFAFSYSGLSDERTREYLLENPEILQEMVIAYDEKQAAERLAQLGDSVYQAFPGAFVGNPNGSRVLVEFTDYNCPYCEASLADVKRLVAEDPELKVVMREYPIFEGSEPASRMALAAAMQGKYEAFHDAMFALSPTTPDAIEAAAERAGLDMERARTDAVSQAVSTELARNIGFARQLGFSGTPAWIAGDKAMNGMVGFDALKEALDDLES
jgi:protein-disulfide isomerase